MFVNKLVRRIAAKRLGISIQKTHAFINFNYRYAEHLLYFNRCFDKIRKLDGDIVECGVGMGRSLMMFAFLVKDSGGGDTYMDLTLLKDFQNFLMKTEMIHLNQGREMSKKVKIKLL